MPINRTWSEIQDFPNLSSDVQRALEQLGPLQSAWQQAAVQDPVAFKETRQRALRSHAIETGIIERLYDVEWGVTEALVAEGISQEVVERTGGIERETLTIINDQYEALQFVSDAARGERSFSVGFIKELHALITRHQSTYDALDQLGRIVNPDLLHGEWKRTANHVTRPDGSVLEYCPPARTQDQMEALVSLYLRSSEQHPVVRAAWLHHRFISIHPFQDGNGRVARALVLLVLLQGQYAPLVVGRDVRATYIEKLDEANDGDLEPLIFLFADLERQAMVRQFQAPIQSAKASGTVLDVARAAARHLSDLQGVAKRQQAAALSLLATELNGRVKAKLAHFETDLRTTFLAVDPQTSVWTKSANIGDSEARQFHGQLVKLARRHQFYANLSDGSWWTTITMKLLAERLRLLVAVVKVGSGDSGVGSVMIQAERLYQDGPDSAAVFEWLFEPTELDQIAITGDLKIDSVWPELDQLIDRCLSASISEFVRSLA